MTATEQAILDTLLDLDRAVESVRTRQEPKPDLIGIFSKLDRLAAELPSNASPDLRHYLQRKSYEKARLLLLDRGAENARGNCGR